MRRLSVEPDAAAGSAVDGLRFGAAEFFHDLAFYEDDEKKCRPVARTK